ncbi:MAG: ABC transporter permease subunit, partial [Alphaproteobacteria bacterium]|nr:ABC transporter permease subunit [Alphaproteobacteria bacterium]
MSVTTARAKGLSTRFILRRHVLRNAAVPILTLTGWELVRGLAGYTIVVETVFAWAGIGYLAIQAIDHQDLPLI